ncbi:phosphatidylserine decarboxylase [Methylophilaceae bacterium]|nr:phosphatidylserine decarboxylase [Methylophilaceae bacterium]
MSNRPAVILQYFLPKQLMTILAGKFANARAGRLTTGVIRWFIRRYGVNMQEAAQPDVQHYATFNDFFTRALRNDARPIAQADLICPVDGAISQFGRIRNGQIFQAKGHHYSTLALLAGNSQLAKKFEHGSFATLYLSPKDYHRIHMPCDGRLLGMTYVPGSLFSVNPATAQGVPGLFARNERVICEFDSPLIGRFALVLVGATIVGSMATVWHGLVNPPRTKEIRHWRYADQAIVLKQGEEMGRFLLGSTVVMLFPEETQFNPGWSAGKAIQLGEAMAGKPASPAASTQDIN